MRQSIISISWLLILAPLTLAEDRTPPVFQAAKHEKGELTFDQGLPIVTVRGTPTEIGEQLGVLIGKNSPNPTPVLNRFLKDIGQEKAFPALKLLAKELQPNFPKDHLAEIQQFAKTSGYDLELFLFVNTVYDFSSGMGCSTMVVEPQRSKTKGPIFGRNFDWVPTQGLHEQTAIFVFHPKGKHAFATVTFAPITGVISGMNDAGLACTLNEIRLNQSKDGSKFDWKGVPTMLAFRRVLEECRTVADAEKLLRSMKRTTTACLTICDTNGGAVFEITPKNIFVRAANNGMTCCTNHFCTEELGLLEKDCYRLKSLMLCQVADVKMGVEEVFTELGQVNQKRSTMQSMVFEPKDLILHLKLSSGKESATLAKPVTLKLKPYLVSSTE